MAHSERYGASHDLARAGFVVKRRLRISMTPLLNFGDARTDDAGEAAMLEKLWQDAGPVAESALAVAGAMETDEELRELTSAFPELPERLREARRRWRTGPRNRVPRSDSRSSCRTERGDP